MLLKSYQKQEKNTKNTRLEADALMGGQRDANAPIQRRGLCQPAELRGPQAQAPVLLGDLLAKQPQLLALVKNGGGDHAAAVYGAAVHWGERIYNENADIFSKKELSLRFSENHQTKANKF